MRSTPRSPEWPTLGLTLLVYATWAAAVLSAGTGSPWAWPVLILTLTLHGSLQHEHIHGHPTSSEIVNAWLAGWPLSLWLPFSVYRRTHRAHHASSELASPRADPESFYVDAERWNRSTLAGRGLRWALQTLLGRLILGPPVVVLSTWRDEALRWRRLSAQARRRERSGLIAWAAGVVVVTTFVVGAGVSPAAYVVGAVLPSLGLTLLRSFAEHRPDEDARRRTVVVESRIVGWLFLHNNLHVVHHDQPGLPWYAIPRTWRARRAAYVADGVPVLAGYRALLPTLLLPKDPPVYPPGGSPVYPPVWPGGAASSSPSSLTR